MQLAVQQQIIHYCNENLDSIADLLSKLSPESYTKKEDWLFDSTIGQHIRHILEFYQCLLKAQESKILNYDRRERKLELEQNPILAYQTIQLLKARVAQIDPALKLSLVVNHHLEKEEDVRIESTSGRELVYCLEHSIHHQAFIKVGLQALGLTDLVSHSFGVAPATIRHYNK